MWKRSTVYSVSFTVNDRTTEFFVDRTLYDQLEPGDEGLLVYSGGSLISFEKQ
jgi:hypothetical protein